MNSILHRIGHGVFVMVLTGFLAGCTTERSARFGLINEGKLAPGESVPGFSFTESDGRVNTFEAVRGEVTIVAFPDTPSWPECTQCNKLEQLASRLARHNTPVTVVSIVTPPQGCEDLQAAFARCDIKGYSQLLALCDDKAQLRDLYGPDAAGKFFVIDSDGQISDSGRLTETGELERAVRAAVEPHEEYVMHREIPD